LPGLHGSPEVLQVSLRLISLVGILGDPTQICASPQGLRKVLSRNCLNAIKNRSVTESHFFEHGKPMMQNVLQVSSARYAYFNFHATIF
jgi:hypothetical protein